MSSRNVEQVRAMYDAFAAGDIEGVLSRMAPDIVWNEAENFPYADGNPYRGPEAVLHGVFARCASEWDDFGVQIDELVDGGDTVVAMGRYSGRYKATGREMNPQVVHVWRMRDGRAVQFQQHVDTLHVGRVVGGVE
ncbi:MAG: nuclear transport factor 2 family protein [Phycisphaerales bacterium]